MKLVIQVPCLNEEATLPEVLAELPRQLEGFDAVEWLVVDDGSTDRTVEVARAHGVDHVVRLTNNKGLAAAFQAGIDAALKLGADVIVNTDADHQYRAADIPRLVSPILAGRADMVVGDRQVKDVEHFSASKKVLQRIGSNPQTRDSRLAGSPPMWAATRSPSSAPTSCTSRCACSRSSRWCWAPARWPRGLPFSPTGSCTGTAPATSSR